MFIFLAKDLNIKIEPNPTKPKEVEKKPLIDVKEMTEEQKKQAQIDADLAHAKELFG